MCEFAGFCENLNELGWKKTHLDELLFLHLPSRLDVICLFVFLLRFGLQAHDIEKRHCHFIYFLRFDGVNQSGMRGRFTERTNTEKLYFIYPFQNSFFFFFCFILLHLGLHSFARCLCHRMLALAHSRVQIYLTFWFFIIGKVLVLLFSLLHSRRPSATLEEETVGKPLSLIIHEYTHKQQ